jgi:hypothetical protein
MRRRNTALWFSVLAPPLSALNAQLIMYSWVPSACHEGKMLPIHVTFACAAIICLIAFALAVPAWRETRDAQVEVAEERDVRPPARAAFMAWGGIGMSVMSLIVDIAMYIAALGHHPCDS